VRFSVASDPKLPLELVRRPAVVAVQEGEPRRYREFGAAVHGPGLTEARRDLADDPRVLADDLDRAILGAVVDDDDFSNGTGLREHALDRLAQIAALIVDGDDGAHLSHAAPP